MYELVFENGGVLNILVIFMLYFYILYIYVYFVIKYICNLYITLYMLLYMLLYNLYIIYIHTILLHVFMYQQTLNNAKFII